MLSRECSTRISVNAISHWFVLAIFLFPLAGYATIVASVAAADKVAELQTHFDHESHATSKVKILERLGEAQFASATRAQQAGNYSDIGFVCEKFRDNVRTSFDLLKVQVPDAEKHADGYRHLELVTRRGIREVEDLLIIVPQEVRPPIEIVRTDLVKMDDELIHLLFPRRTKDPEQTPPPPGVTP